VVQFCCPGISLFAVAALTSRSATSAAHRGLIGLSGTQACALWRKASGQETGINRG